MSPARTAVPGSALEVALLVHLLGEAARGGEVGEDDVAAQAKERLVKLVAIARRARHVELAGERRRRLGLDGRHVRVKS